MERDGRSVFGVTFLVVILSPLLLRKVRPDGPREEAHGTRHHLTDPGVLRLPEVQPGAPYAWWAR